MDFDTATVRIGDDLYEPLIGSVRNDPDALAQMWAEAESRLAEHAAKRWTVAYRRDGELLVPLAWCADEPGERLGWHKGTEHYHHLAGRSGALIYGHVMFAMVVAARQRLLTEDRFEQVEAYVFPGAEPALAAAGWQPDLGVYGTSTEPGIPPHAWRRWTWTRR